MWNPVAPFADAVKAFSYTEKRNIALFTAGTMIYKLGLDAFNGAMITIAIRSWDHQAPGHNTPSKTFQRVGMLISVHQVCQCIGSLLIAPMAIRFSAKNVLSLLVIVFALLTAAIFIRDAAIIGHIKGAAGIVSSAYWYGKYKNILLPLSYSLCGVCQGMVEVVRRIIPRDIVGSDARKLRRMDALVHIFAALGGVVGTSITSLHLRKHGDYVLFIGTPICFSLAAVPWFFLKLDFKRVKPTDKKKRWACNIFTAMFRSIAFFGESAFLGAKLVFTHRKFIWLLPCFAFAMFSHAFLLYGIAPIIASRYLGHPAWLLIMICCSNIGQLLGGIFVFVFASSIPTPVPWLRIEGIIPVFLWILPGWQPSHTIGQAWLVGAFFVPITFGFAAGDISIATYLYPSTPRIDARSKSNDLGAVISFLYLCHLIGSAISFPVLGYSMDWNENNTSIRDGVYKFGVIMLTVLFSLVFWSTFIPKGAICWNPKTLFDERLDHEEGDDVEMSSRGHEGGGVG